MFYDIYERYFRTIYYRIISQCRRTAKRKKPQNSGKKISEETMATTEKVKGKDGVTYDREVNRYLIGPLTFVNHAFVVFTVTPKLRVGNM